MNIAEKLKIIGKLSGLTQEKLAAELGVSFATFNSWINARSVPRKKAEGRIDELYRQYSGQKSIPSSVLEAKKDIILQKSRTKKNFLKRTDIYEQFMLSMTYNTNSIEGSTFTELETAAVLFDNVSIPGKSVTEHLEVKNHQAALGYMLEYIVHSGGGVDEALVLKLHGMLMNGIMDNAGAYRRHPVRIAGVNIATANFLKVPVLMKDLMKDAADEHSDIIQHIAAVHSRFEQIHPFSDGNGRIGRLLMNAMALRGNIAPIIIKQEKKRLYYTYLQKAQVYDDTTLLEDFICDAILEWFDIM
ncbi:MAG: Fic family protein [Planctomycetes bacterium]|nr:Fic family protein [Planctomycetota bacterium]